jgi:hypothetical protein
LRQRPFLRYRRTEIFYLLPDDELFEFLFLDDELFEFRDGELSEFDERVGVAVVELPDERLGVVVVERLGAAFVELLDERLGVVVVELLDERLGVVFVELLDERLGVVVVELLDERLGVVTEDGFLVPVLVFVAGLVDELREGVEPVTLLPDCLVVVVVAFELLDGVFDELLVVTLPEGRVELVELLDGVDTGRA